VSDQARIAELTLCLAHDLKSPLAAIISNAHYVLEDDQHNAELDGAVKDILGATDFLLRMLQDLEAIAAHANGKLEARRERVELSDLLGVIKLESREAATLRDHRLELKVTPPNAVASIDRALVSRALRNLVDNSISYSPPRSQIALEASLDEAGTLTLCVKDDGPRVPAELHERVFSRFGRLDRDRVGRVGRGVSLHYCEIAALAHDGNIVIRDDGERGVLFRMTLPNSQYS
jgi:K+-sensing histidine kinase KdpD